jgi:uncharacterized Ntn-hydrolase superfamily protein
VTFSLLGRCEATGMVGMAISSSSPAVASRCAFVRAGAGVAASQNITDPRLGPALLDALEAGADAPGAIEQVAASAPDAAYRQLACVDARGGSAARSGERALGLFGHRVGDGCVAAGNLLAGLDVLDAMRASFEASGAPLPARLLAGLRAGVDAGGEAGPVHSAGLLVARDVPWPVVDLRVDWHDTDPIGELERLWALWAPQMDDYVTRALDPASAPGYGVPGDGA